MSTTVDYLNSVLERLSGIDGIAYRKVMVEYIFYFRDKVERGRYDNKFLIKPVSAAKRFMPDAEFEMLYSGAKEMLRVIDSMNTEGLKDMLNAMYDELPELNRGKKK